MNKKILLTLIFVAVANFMFAQVKISGEFRPRTEYSHGVKGLAKADQDASTFTSQRTRLNLFYKSENVITKLVLQDVRIWGSQKQLVSNQDKATSVHEAWAEVFFSKKLSLKAGRQEVVYDDHRIFGSVGWAHQARSHDMAILKYSDGFNLHFGVAYNEDGNRVNDFYTVPSYKSLQFAWFNKKINNSLSLSLLGLNNGFASDESGISGKLEKHTILYKQTFGTHIAYKTKTISLGVNGYYQMGEASSTTDISAYNFGVNLGIKSTKNITVTLGYELLSGTDFGELDDMNSFAPFYGTNHKFNGFMDYFYVGNHGANVGLSDLYLKAKYKKDKFFVEGHVHFFSAAAKMKDDADKYLGTEIDLVAGYTVSKQANIKVGYSHMFGSDSMELLKGGDKSEINNWAWLMLTVKPTFLNK